MKLEEKQLPEMTVPDLEIQNFNKEIETQTNSENELPLSENLNLEIKSEKDQTEKLKLSEQIEDLNKKMDEMKGEKIKFTFVNLDERQNWDKVKYFAKEAGLDKNIVLFDFSAPTPDFFSKNFTTWRGDAIPFTLITKGDKRDETLGSVSKEELAHKIDKLK